MISLLNLAERKINPISSVIGSIGSSDWSFGHRSGRVLLEVDDLMR